MKTRRFLAALLGIVVAVSSEGLSGTAYAAAADQTLTTAIVEEADIQADAITDGIANDAQSVIGESAPELSDESAGPDNTLAEGAEDTEVIILQDEDGGAAESSVQDTTEPLGAASGFFEVDADGVLRVKSGMTASGTVIVPSDAKMIPKGILNNPGVTGIVFEPDSQLTTIEAGAFEGSQITGIIIPKGVTRIEDATFKNVDTLATVSLESGSRLSSVGKEAFQNTAITSFIAVPVTDIDSSAFMTCTELANLDLPNLSSIGAYAFSGCSSLNSIAFSKELSSIGAQAFSNSGLTSVDLSGSEYLTIGNSAFAGITALTSVILPDGLSEIPAKAFYACPNLSTLVIGTGFNSETEIIGTSAFEKCISLTTVRTFNVKRFEANAFAGCTKLSTILINYPTPDDDEFTIIESAFPMGKKSSDGKTKLDTIKGYDGRVQEYASERGYNYISLAVKHKLTVDTKADKDLYNKAEIKANPSKDIVAGTKVTVTVIPKEGYVLDDIEVKSDTSVTNVELSDNNAKALGFTFIMPDEDSIVYVKMIEKSKANIVPDGYNVLPINGYVPVKTKDGLTFDMSGRDSKLVITGEGKTLKTWHFDFTSSSSSVSVSSMGVLRSVKQDSAIITVKSRINGKTLNIPVSVSKTAVIDSIELVLPTVAKSARFGYESIYEADEDGEDEEIEIPLVVYNKAAIDTGERSFNVKINASAEGEDRSLIVESQWSTSDKSVATVKSSTSTDNTNVITVKKGSLGDAMITVTVKGAGDKVTPETTRRFIVRVMDTTPRIDSDTVEVNSRATIGTRINVTPVYGWDIFNDALTLRIGKPDGVICSDLEVNFVEGKYYISSKSNSAFEKVYKDSNKLYLTGTYADEPTQSFNIPLTQVSVVKTELNPTIKMSDKINLFYDRSVDGGSVKLTQSIKNVEVDEICLVSSDNYKSNKKYNAEEDAFRENFRLTRVDNMNYIITRTGNDLVQDKNGNDVLSGYLYIRYEGYREGMWRQLTIPTYNKAPEYVLSVSSATVSSRAADQEINIQILDKKTKKQVLSLANLDDDIIGGGLPKGLGLDEAGKKLFEVPDINSAMSTDTITLKVKDVPQSGTATLYVQDELWSKPLKFKFTLKAVSDVPKVTLSSTTAELNTRYPSQEAFLIGRPARKDATIVGYDNLTYAGSAKLAGAAEDIMNEMDLGSDGVITLGLPSDVPAGAYKFKVTPVLEFDGSGNTANGNVLSFSVKVVSKNPSIKLKNSTFKLNANYPEEETVETTYTLAGLPTGATGEVVKGSGFTVVPKKNTNPDFDDIAEIEFVDGKARVQLLDDAQAFSGNLAYTLSGLEAVCGSDSVPLPNITITLSLIKAAPSVKVKATGTLNPVDAASFISYTATLVNVTGEITDVKVVEWNTEYNAKYEDENDQHFVFDYDQDNKKAILRINNDNIETLKNNTTYKLTLSFMVNGAIPAETDVKVTPKQVYPPLTITQSKKIIYSSIASENRTVTVTITQTEPKKGKTWLDSTITGVVFAKDTAESVKKAFRIKDYDPLTGEMELWLANPSMIAQNKEYTIKFVPTYQGQAGQTTADAFSVKLSVRR